MRIQSWEGRTEGCQLSNVENAELRIAKGPCRVQEHTDFSIHSFAFVVEAAELRIAGLLPMQSTKVKGRALHIHAWVAKSRIAKLQRECGLIEDCKLEDIKHWVRCRGGGVVDA